MPDLNTSRLHLRLPQFGEENTILDFYQQNSDYLQPWDPPRPDNFFTAKYWLDWIQSAQEAAFAEQTYRFLLFYRQSGEMIGFITLSTIERGPFQNGRLGYKIAEKMQKQGLMTEALAEVTKFAFEQLNLHRLEANVMPHNSASRNVLTRLGFKEIGVAEKYLFINGEWRDHILTALINGDYRP